jgi:recombination protein RecA
MATNILDVNKVLATTIHAIEKQFGKGAVMLLGDQDCASEHPAVIPSGSLALDVALGIGGLPRGRVVEVYGPEASGKTTLALAASAEAQKLGGVVAYVDAEHALDLGWARRLGVRAEELLVCQPDHGEQALEIVDTLVRCGAVDLVVVDSVAALTPKAELEGEMGDAHVGLQARLMSQALRKLTASVHRTQTTVLFINQIRNKIGVMFGSPETTTGGNALKFYASVRLDVRRVQSLKDGETSSGNRTKVRVVKNKMAPPFREAEFDLMFGTGICRLGELLDLGESSGIIEKSGSWISAGGERLGQGRDKAREALRQNASLLSSLEEQVLTAKNVSRVTTRTQQMVN